MFRIWFKIYIENKIIKDTVIVVNSKDSRKEKALIALDEACMFFDLQKPMWLSDIEKDFVQFGRVSFNQNHFIEVIDFEILELEIIEDEQIQ